MSEDWGQTLMSLSAFIDEYIAGPVSGEAEGDVTAAAAGGERRLLA